MKLIKKFSLVAMLLVAILSLAACAPKDPVKAKEKLEEAGYAVIVDGTVQPGILKLAGVDGVSSVITATNGEELLQAYYFAEKGQAKDALEALTKWAEKNGKESNFSRSGKWLYAGTEQAIKDFK